MESDQTDSWFGGYTLTAVRVPWTNGLISLRVNFLS